MHRRNRLWLVGFIFCGIKSPIIHPAPQQADSADGKAEIFASLDLAACGFQPGVKHNLEFRWICATLPSDACH
jgi:hypothetical protein